eukprot:TRINITY_DN1390_c0_g3_i1.p2 TRINITY_DN1390_c0_g3~~TRINITY_DN1390_c0_g3_i1.p2  ORF type:complete len:106 (+),score=5.86 TRINITY_DN1390_c0_g3_i1:234-551(+)
MIRPLHTTMRKAPSTLCLFPPMPPPHDTTTTTGTTGTEVPFASVRRCARTALLCAQCTPAHLLHCFPAASHPHPGFGKGSVLCVLFVVQHPAGTSLANHPLALCI